VYTHTYYNIPGQRYVYAKSIIITRYIVISIACGHYQNNIPTRAGHAALLRRHRWLFVGRLKTGPIKGRRRWPSRVGFGVGKLRR
jgi:hypothetical protein